MTVRSVEKAVEVLVAVAEASEPVSLTDVASQTGLPVATAKRLLDTLTKTHLLSKKNKLYSPGIRLFEIGKKAEQRMDLVSAAMPYLTDLRDKVGESANLAVLDKTDVVYLASVESPRMMRTFTVPGARVPAHCTGVGKVLLAQKSDKELRKLYEECVSPQHSGSVASGSVASGSVSLGPTSLGSVDSSMPLGDSRLQSPKACPGSPGSGGVTLHRFTSNTITSVDMLIEEINKVRQLGYATDEGEREDGVVCIAAPVRDYSGSTVAAVSISGPASRLDEEGMSKARAYVIECGQDITRSLGGTGR